MPKYAANLTLLFQEYPLLERFGAAKAAGFEAVEILFPYDVPAPEILDRLAILNMPLVMMSCPPPNYTGGDRGYAAMPDRVERFRHDFRRSARYAKALGAKFLHVMAGPASGPEAHATFVENLRWACDFAPAQQLLIEPMGPANMPDYFLNDFDQALAIIDEVGAKNLHLQFDTYQAAQLGDVQALWAKVRAKVAHVQVGGMPDRAEPVGHVAFLKQLDADGYTGWVSAEYRPAADTVKGLGWRV